MWHILPIAISIVERAASSFHHGFEQAGSMFYLLFNIILTNTILDRKGEYHDTSRAASEFQRVEVAEGTHWTIGRCWALSGGFRFSIDNCQSPIKWV